MYLWRKTSNWMSGKADDDVPRSVSHPDSSVALLIPRRKRRPAPTRMPPVVVKATLSSVPIKTVCPKPNSPEAAKPKTPEERFADFISFLEDDKHKHKMADGLERVRQVEMFMDSVKPELLSSSSTGKRATRTQKAADPEFAAARAQVTDTLERYGFDAKKFLDNSFNKVPVADKKAGKGKKNEEAPVDKPKGKKAAGGKRKKKADEEEEAEEEETKKPAKRGFTEEEFKKLQKENEELKKKLSASDKSLRFRSALAEMVAAAKDGDVETVMGWVESAEGAEEEEKEKKHDAPKEKEDPEKDADEEEEDKHAEPKYSPTSPVRAEEDKEEDKEEEKEDDKEEDKEEDASQPAASTPPVTQKRKCFVCLVDTDEAWRCTFSGIGREHYFCASHECGGECTACDDWVCSEHAGRCQGVRDPEDGLIDCPESENKSGFFCLSDSCFCTDDVGQCWTCVKAEESART